MSPRRKSGGHRPKRRLIADAAEPEPQRPWQIRFVESVIETDAHDIGNAAMAIALKAIDKKLKIDPLQYGDRLHRPLHPLFKLRSGDVRIVYRVEEETRQVFILAIGNRRDIWDDEVAILKRKSTLEEALSVEFQDDFSVSPRTRQQSEDP
jgi:mRNA-degrading endonuclease RelE of RelBE toxin-antitoxin system